MRNQWYLSRKDELLGPYSFAQLSEMVRQGDIIGNDLVSPSEQIEWRRVDSELSLFVHLNCDEVTSNKPKQQQRVSSPAIDNSQLELSALEAEFQKLHAAPEVLSPASGRDSNSPDLPVEDFRNDPAATIVEASVEVTPKPVVEPKEQSKKVCTSNPEIAATVGDALKQLLLQKTVGKPDKKKNLFSGYLTKALGFCLSGVVFIIMFPFKLIRFIISFCMDKIFESSSSNVSGKQSSIKFLNTLNAYSDSYFTSSGLHLFLRLTAPIICMNLTAFWLLNFSNNKVVQFPSRDSQNSKLVFPFIGGCSELEYWIFFLNMVALIGIISFVTARWLEAQTDD